MWYDGCHVFLIWHELCHICLSKQRKIADWNVLYVQIWVQMVWTGFRTQKVFQFFVSDNRKFFHEKNWFKKHFWPINTNLLKKLLIFKVLQYQGHIFRQIFIEVWCNTCYFFLIWHKLCDIRQNKENILDLTVAVTAYTWKNQYTFIFRWHFTVHCNCV